MNATDILKYGQLTVLRSLDGLPDSAWGTEGVCGWWSVKDIIAHLASFEHVLVEVLNTCLTGGPTPTLDQYRGEKGDQFNDAQVELRSGNSPGEVLMEYNETQARTMSLVARISPETLRQTGTIPWYGIEYALDDFMVYAYYGHKREHTAQINVFRDLLKSQGLLEMPHA